MRNGDGGACRMAIGCERRVVQIADRAQANAKEREREQSRGGESADGRSETFCTDASTARVCRGRRGGGGEGRGRQRGTGRAPRQCVLVAWHVAAPLLSAACIRSPSARSFIRIPASLPSIIDLERTQLTHTRPRRTRHSIFLDASGEGAHPR